MMMKAPFLATTGLVLAGLALASVPIALADTVGSPCNDWMTIGTDSATGDRMFCAQTRPGGSTDGYIVWCTGGVWSIYSP